VISIIWLWGTLLIAGFFPIIDGRYQILVIFKALWKRSSSVGYKQRDKADADVAGINSSEGSAAVSISTPFPEK
jgi:hypothetical protein